MEKSELKKAIQNRFPAFDQTALLEVLVTEAKYIHLPPETTILQTGDYIQVIPLVIRGSVKVLREDREGKEALLYYIRSGQSCAMTLTSCMRRARSSIKAITQESTELLAIPTAVIYGISKQFPSWQSFVYDSFDDRFNEVLEALDNVIFHKMDDRLSKYLTTKSTTLAVDTLKISHQEIAAELATSREVVSRLLKQFEKKGLLQLQRGQIKLTGLI